MIHIANKTYEVVVDHKNGWKPDAFRDRYSEVLERYDFIVGDWGYNQLRLRGFFKDTHPKATKETSIATLQDYLNEYCNFGCAYFIIEKIPNKHQANQPQESAEQSEPDLQESAASEQPHNTEPKEPASNREPQKEAQQPQQAQNHHPQPRRNQHPNQQNREANHNHHSRPRNHHNKQGHPSKQGQQGQQHVKQQ
ncbi:YutD family protein [Paenibacillus sp. OAS669]|uniref:YutD family protein n=1 Tax=Paenibacillus sp. OAS669 TaxID=2663821 RepID=UPI0019FE94A2|nr:YutD-like domain-containing protein [Paenibacillus sp. OAS669]MBE1444377.1 uncharacterized protein YutD [Paenibacillus sp. OAS669]